jgi:murein DD-endopeptidase MepM/ murein hydrolase activator NlpD
VRAVGSGTVTFAGYIAGKPVISIELANSITALGSRVRSTYEPVNSLISTGSYVRAGEVIGHINFSSRTSGHCRDSCLHFGLKVVNEANSRYLSPRILWRSLAVLHPSPVLTQSQILDEQSRKSYGAFQRSRGCNAVSLPLMHARVALEPPSCRLPLQGHV